MPLFPTMMKRSDMRKLLDLPQLREYNPEKREWQKPADNKDQPPKTPHERLVSAII
jgi:hypothetical protein